jgi:hypothetical protein
MLFNIEGFYGSQPAERGQEPNEKQMATLKQLQTELKADGCKRLETKRPGAMVFLDNSLGVFHNAVHEVNGLCPGVDAMLRDHYTKVDVAEARSYKVYLSNENVARHR